MILQKTRCPIPKLRSFPGNLSDWLKNYKKKLKVVKTTKIFINYANWLRTFPYSPLKKL